MSRTVQAPPPGRLPLWHDDLVFVVSSTPDNTAVERDGKESPAPSALEEVRAALGSLPAQAALGCVLAIAVCLALFREPSPAGPMLALTAGEPVTTGSIAPPLRSSLD